MLDKGSENIRASNVNNFIITLEIQHKSESIRGGKDKLSWHHCKVLKTTLFVDSLCRDGTGHISHDPRLKPHRT